MKNSTVLLNTTSPPLSTTLNPLLHRVVCNGPHIDEFGQNFTYKLTDGFVAGTTVFSVLNALFVLPTVFMNGIILAILVKNKNLRTRANRVLFTICAADFLVGLVVEPVMSAHLIRITKEDHQCELSTAIVFMVPVLLVVTMVTHAIIALERYCSVKSPTTHAKWFTKLNISVMTAFVWVVAFLGFVVPYLIGQPIMGTKVLGFLVIGSIGICAFFYLSIYQAYEWKDGKPKTKIKGAYVVRTVEEREFSPEEKEQLNSNFRVAMIYWKLCGCMLVFYVLYIVKGLLQGYSVFKGNDYFTVSFVFDTILSFHALVNPCLVLYLEPQLINAAQMMLS